MADPSQPKTYRPYFEKLKDPRWQKRRLEIMQRDQFQCQECFDTAKTLNVHHLWYEKGKDPWDYPDEMLRTLCEECHKDNENRMSEITRSVAGALIAQHDLLVLIRAGNFPGGGYGPTASSAITRFTEFLECVREYRESEIDPSSQAGIEQASSVTDTLGSLVMMLGCAAQEVLASKYGRHSNG